MKILSGLKKKKAQHMDGYKKPCCVSVIPTDPAKGLHSEECHSKKQTQWFCDKCLKARYKAELYFANILCMVLFFLNRFWFTMFIFLKLKTYFGLWKSIILNSTQIILMLTHRKLWLRLFKSILWHLVVEVSLKVRDHYISKVWFKCFVYKGTDNDHGHRRN